MRFLHFADFHLGVTTHGSMVAGGINSRVLDFLDCLDYLCDYVESNHMDFIVFAGDAFHHNTPTPYYVSEFGERLKRLADCCPVIMIPGNHDIASTRDVSAVDVYGVMDVPNLYCSDQPIARTIKTEAGDVYVACVPYPTKRIYCDRSGTNEELLDALEQTILTMADEAPEDLPRILIGHFTVQGGKFGAWSPPVMGKEATVRSYVFDDRWDYVALGHLHMYQVVQELPPVIYAGSLSRIDFGEADEPKGFVVCEIDELISHKFIEVPNRRMVTVHVDCRGQEFPQEYLAAELKSAEFSKKDIVRVRIDVDRTTDVTVAPFKKRFEKVYHFQGFSVTPHVTDMNKRLDEYLEEGERVNSLQPDEVLEIYLLDAEIDDGEIDVLLDLFQDIVEEVENE